MSKFMNRPPPPVLSAPNNSAFVEKLMIGLDHSPAAFDLRGQLIGAGGANLNYIRNETGANATLRGRGSMFIDPGLGTESQEPMHLYIEHTRFDGLQQAKQLARNLIETLQQELIHFQQMNPPVPTSIQFSQQPVQTIQPATQVISAQNVIPQMSIPPPMLAVPPPQIQSASIMQQSNIITQNAQTMVTASTQQVQSAATQPQIIQQQTILPQNVPGTIQIHRPANMVIQQSVQSNLSVPPPSIHMKPNQIVSQVQLSQPPPNIQIQSQPGPQMATQIVLNQPAQTYQYIQQPSNADTNQNQVTIQHIYQPQGIVTQTTQPINQFTQQSANLRPTQPQQYIVQGNAAYPCITAVPPPNIIQQQHPPPQSTTQQNIIFQTTQNTPNSMPLQQLQLHAPPPQMVENQSSHTNGTEHENGTAIKDEKSTPEPNNENIVKTDDKSDVDNHENLENNPQINQTVIQSQSQPQISMNVPPPIQFTPAPIMAVPPPMTCVQHIMGNTLITSSQPAGTQTHQIYNQIPVSLQQIQTTAPPGQPHQIHVTSGQHILVNAQQYQTQPTFQQMPHSFQITTAPQPRSGPNEIVMVSNQPMVSNQTIVAPSMNQQEMRPNMQTQPPTGVFNPHMAPPPVVQFQPMMHPPIMQTIDNSQSHQSQIIESQQQNQFQMQQQHQMQNISIQSNQPQPVPFQQQQQPPLNHQRMQLKRKRGGDDNGHDQPIKQFNSPRIGMGSNNNGGHQQQAQQFMSNMQPAMTSSNNLQTSTSLSIVSSTAATMTTTKNQDEPQLSSSTSNFNNFKPNFSEGNETFYRMPPTSTGMGHMMMNSGMPPRGPPRFQNNQGNNQMHRMNFGPPPPPPPLPQGQRPRFMNR